MERAELVELVSRMKRGDFASDGELEAAAIRFRAAVPHPRALGLIYHWDSYFDHDPTPEEIVEAATSYSGIAL